MNAYDNEVAELAHLRGAVAQDLHGAFKEWQVQAETLTRCQKYLYSLSINPDPAQGPLTRAQYMDYIHRAEETLGLKDQPRAVVFHVKQDREHCHVVWSRIDADQQRAVHLAFDRDKLMRVTRGFARDHGLDLPAGYEKSRQVGQVSLYEQAQRSQTGLSKDDHKRQVTEAWKYRDDARAFVQALAERGYILATGNRPYVLVDLYGNMNALPKLIDDKAVQTKEVRAFLEKEFPPESLPTVEEAQRLVAEHRKLIEQSVGQDRLADRLTALKHGQRERRQAIETEQQSLRHRQHCLRLAQQTSHRAERDKLRTDHRQTMKAIRTERYQNRSTGLGAFLGKLTGVTFIQHKVHRYQDAQRIKAYREQQVQLKTRQAEEQKTLDLRLRLQAQEVERKLKALDKVDQREQAALQRDQRTEQRIRSRGEDGAMPSLARLAGPKQASERGGDTDLLSAFAGAKDRWQQEPPDLLAAFSGAARSRDGYKSQDVAGKVLEGARPPDGERSDGPAIGRDRDR